MYSKIFEMSFLIGCRSIFSKYQFETLSQAILSYNRL